MTDLLDYRDGGPGWKGKETSREAAKAIQGSVSRLEQIVIDTIRDHGPMTADQVAMVSGIDKLSIRPRCSQLADEDRKGGALLKDTGTTRPNSSGKQATVWGLVKMGEG